MFFWCWALSFFLIGDSSSGLTQIGEGAYFVFDISFTRTEILKILHPKTTKIAPNTPNIAKYPSFCFILYLTEFFHIDIVCIKWTLFAMFVTNIRFDWRACDLSPTGNWILHEQAVRNMPHHLQPYSRPPWCTSSCYRILYVKLQKMWQCVSG